MSPNPRMGRSITIVAAIIAAGLVLYWLKGALFPFIIGIILAYVLYPLVSRLERVMPWRRRRPGLSRAAAILLVYILAAGAVTGALFLIIPPAFAQATAFLGGLPELYKSARITIEGWNQQYADKIPEDIRLRIQDAANNAGTILIGGAQTIASKTFGVVRSALTIVLGLAIVPLFLYYLLKDRETITEGIVSLFPSSAQTHARNVIDIINQTFGNYVKAQFILMIVVGTMVFLGMFILGIRYAFLLGIVAGLFEVVPIIGPWLGAVPGVLVTLATSPEDIVWVVLVYAGVQLLENALLVPHIQGRTLNIHPILVMIALVIGSEIAGIWGILLSAPVAAVTKGLYTYFREDSRRRAEAAAAPDAEALPEQEGISEGTPEAQSVRAGEEDT
jgi:predicted PurR-regulated permease PerM